MPDSQTVNLCTVAYDLKSHGYNYAITKPGHLDSARLQFSANQYRLFMLAQLRKVYCSGLIKHHIIGIMPVVNGNESHMHTIVKECQPKRKMIPLNEENLIWCSGECKSYSVNQLVAFVLGEKAVKS